MSGTAHRPDFLVEGLGQPFLLEAKVLEEESESAAQDRLRADVWGALNTRLTSEHFFVRC